MKSSREVCLKSHKKVLENPLESLAKSLLKDLSALNIPTDFTLKLRFYSKYCFGKYDPNSDVIILYVFADKNHCNLYSYELLLRTLIHECVHRLQWKSETYVRLKGVMHNAEFYKLFNEYSKLARGLLYLREVMNSE